MKTCATCNAVHNWTLIANNNRLTVFFYLCDTKEQVEEHLLSLYKANGRSTAGTRLISSMKHLSNEIVECFKRVWQTVELSNAFDIPCNGYSKHALPYVLKGLQDGTEELIRSYYNDYKRATTVKGKPKGHKSTLQDFCRRLEARHPENYSRMSFEKSVYERALQKMQVVCKQHPANDWWVTPNQLLNGSKCPLCAEEDRERYRNLSKLVRAKLQKGEKLARKREDLEAVAGVLKVVEEYTWQDFCRDIRNINSNWVVVQEVDGLYAEFTGGLEKCKLTRQVLISTWGTPVNGLVGPSVISTTPLQVFKKAKWWPEKLLRVRSDLVVDFPEAESRIGTEV